MAFMVQVFQMKTPKPIREDDRTSSVMAGATLTATASESRNAIYLRGAGGSLHRTSVLLRSHFTKHIASLCPSSDLQSNGTPGSFALLHRQSAVDFSHCPLQLHNARPLSDWHLSALAGGDHMTMQIASAA
jgi:hypothetical protein